MSTPLERKFQRTKRKVTLLEKMIESKTRELYLQQLELEKNNQFLSRILVSMSGGVVVTDADLRIALANQAAANIAGRLLASLSGQKMQDAFPLKATVSILNQRNFELLPFEQTEDVLELNDGKEFKPVSCSFALVRDDAGQVESVVCLLNDLSEKKSLERKLVQSQKLESVGQLAAGIAHEINTPIQYVRDNTVFIKEEFLNLKRLIESMLESLEDYKRKSLLNDQAETVFSLIEDLDLDYLLQEIPLALDQSFEGAESVARIVRSMKAFSHPGTNEKVHVDVNAALDSTVTVSKNEWKYVADIDLCLDPNLPSLKCFPGDLNQVFLNLIVNAAHAISEATEGGKLGKGRIGITTRFEQGQIMIKIEDSGCGIPDAIKGRIFDPFFTTKQIGKGTGQGLAMVHATIVERHGGVITFESKQGEGTKFKIV
ncbi:MAG: PAS domain-containing protein, partial [Bdellovibrionales bacterium]|nr:PAS domain-containing protein [Bdellovibrionales bacterium]